MEIWKDIPRYEGIYQASSEGRIRSAPGKTTFTKRHGVRHWETRIIKPKKCANFNACGYRVTLWKDGKAKDFLVARLVCTTFHEDLIETNMTVNHIDGNRLNNKIENLEWLTLGDNIRAGFDTGLYKKAQKKVSLVNKETKERIDFDSFSQASRFLGKNNGYLSCRINRECFSAFGSDTEYEVIV